MTRGRLSFGVLGNPAPQGSHTAKPIYAGGQFTGRVAVHESSASVKPWRDSVQWAAVDAMHKAKLSGPLTGPVVVNVTFRLKRPLSDFSTGRTTTHLVRPSAPTFPIKRPDIDKLVRSTFDALTLARVWADDAEVAEPQGHQGLRGACREAGGVDHHLLDPAGPRPVGGSLRHRDRLGRSGVAVNVLELFAGIGGLSLGLERAGMTVVGQVEIDPYCRRVLARHWPEVPRHDDVRTCLGWWRSEPRPPVELVAGGFPCQPASAAGHRLGLADERWLWPHMADVVRVLRPSFVLVENVPGLFVRGFDAVLGDLAALGYDATWDCVPAAAVGAPH